MNQRQDEILDTFIQLIEQYGIDKTTMQDIAKKVGCSVGTLYNQFANKEELIEAFCLRIQTIIINELEKIPMVDLSLEHTLRGIVVGHIKIFNKLLRQNQGFRELLNERNSFRYIGKKTMNFRFTLKTELTKRVSTVLKQGVEQGIFEIADVNRTASLFFDAFSEYWAPPLVAHRDSDEIIGCAEDMFALLMRAIRPGGCNP